MPTEKQLEIESIEFTRGGLNVIGAWVEYEVLELKDGTTRRLEISRTGYAGPVGINDFDGDQEKGRAAIRDRIAQVTGEAAALPFADVAVAQMERDAERLERIRVSGERDEIAAAYERIAAEKRDIENEREQLRTQRDEARNQLLQSEQAALHNRGVRDAG